MVSISCRLSLLNVKKGIFCILKVDVLNIVWPLVFIFYIWDSILTNNRVFISFKNATTNKE